MQQLPCAAGTYSTQEAGTRSPYVQYGGPWDVRVNTAPHSTLAGWPSWAARRMTNLNSYTAPTASDCAVGRRHTGYDAASVQSARPLSGAHAPSCSVEPTSATVSPQRVFACTWNETTREPPADASLPAAAGAPLHSCCEDTGVGWRGFRLL